MTSGNAAKVTKCGCRTRYGEIWTVGHPADPEILPRVPHLVISGDLYNDAGLGAIVVEIDPNQLRAASVA